MYARADARESATVLAADKGWVLPVLAMLAPKTGRCAWLRAGPVPAPSNAALALRCAPCRAVGVGTKGVPPTNAQEALPGWVSNKKLTR